MSKNDGNRGKKKQNKTGIIHELKYMDVDDVKDMGRDKDDMDENESVGTEDNDEFVGHKNESDADGNEETNDIEDDDSTIRENIRNKMNKSETLKRESLDKLNGENGSKKKAKADKVEGRNSKEGRLTGLEKSGGKKKNKNKEHYGKTIERIAKVKDVKPNKGASAE